MNPARKPRGHLRVLFAAASVALASSAATPAWAAGSYTLFESGQVRPLALSPSGKLLFAANTPDNRLEVFRVTHHGLTHRASISVGLEPVAVAARSEREVWVVNHLSDSVSVVELDPSGHGGRVVRTLLVGDEPRDIVFAGPGRRRAFITTAHRGQNVPYDPQLTTPGIGRADVWVFDAAALGASLGGDPLTILALFTDTPRALAASPSGDTVYAAGFHSGNRTTTVIETMVPNGGEANGGVPWPSTNFQGVPAPEVGIIAKFDGAHWVDELGRHWDHAVRFSLPDKDVFAIDAMASPPAPKSGPGAVFAGVGTVLFNMAVNPVSGKVYVSNTEALNEVRFEGPGIFAGSSVRGHLHESRITVLDHAGGVTPRHLNKHINYDACCAPLPNAENERSLAMPLDMAVTSDGGTLYVAAFSSSKIGVYSTAALEADTFVPSTASQIPVSGGGPSGLALDEARDRLYALTRFDNAISIIDTASGVETAHIPLYNPEPPSVVAGRPLLYDASFSSSHGDSSCASCHVFGDLDSLAWDLGNPDAPVLTNPGPFPFGLTHPITGAPLNPDFHPMKGPMTTQSLRGLANHGPMHWRGDRTGANDAPSAQPDSGIFDERAAFEKFQDGFTDLLGRHDFIPHEDMEAFTDFILQVTYPPNPIRALDSSLTPEQQLGRDIFSGSLGGVIDRVATCADCHTLDPGGNPGTDAPGFFGSNGMTNFDFGFQFFKPPHLRNAYQKIGMFGLPNVVNINPGDNDFKGDQVRGFGFLHDGSFDTALRFINVLSFNLVPGNPGGMPLSPEGMQMRRALEAFVLAFDSNMAPIVGQQVTLSAAIGAAAGPRIDLLIDRAGAGECDLVVKGRFLFEEVGFLYIGGGLFQVSRQGLPPIPDSVLRQIGALPGHELTYTCAPPGSGARIALDRDEDGSLDGDELDGGSDPADPGSVP